MAKNQKSKTLQELSLEELEALQLELQDAAETLRVQRIAVADRLRELRPLETARIVLESMGLTGSVSVSPAGAEAGSQSAGA